MKVESDLQKAAAYAESVRKEYESKLTTLVDIPSVSADPARKKDIEKLAQVATDLLKEFGAKSEIIPTKGNPCIYGEYIAGADCPTVLVYNHMDVQPADPAEWRSPPFSMAVDGDVYRGRGSTDDKGPALAVLYAARYAHQHKVPLNIKFIWELEEEIGSPNFEEFIKQNKKKLAAGSVVVSDTIWVSRERPAVAYGLRGLQGALVKLKTGGKDVHSGTTGGLARNPVGELCQLIEACYDAKTGQVKIPGFYEGVRKPSQEEIDHFKASGFSLADFQKANELFSLRTNNTEEAFQRIWAQPTFEVHGIVGGYTGPSIKTIVPHEAEAKISMRLVPDQDPEKVYQLFANFVKSKLPDAQVERAGSLKPYQGEHNDPYNSAASNAIKVAFGKTPAFTREGGSIGAVVSMHEVLSAPIVLLGLSLPEHGYHAINENFDWQQASGGIKVFIEYFQELAKIKK